jgi:pentatricopeptide repeat protein
MTMRLLAATVTLLWLMLGPVSTGLSQCPADRAGGLIAQSLTTFERGENTDATETKIALYAHALDLAEQAVRLNPKSAHAHYATFISRGRLMVLEGVRGNLMHASQLSRSLERALTLDPNHVGALVGRGSLKRELPRWLGGNLKDAEADFTRALELDPQSVDARLGLISTYVKADRLADAERLLNDMRALRVSLKTRQQRLEAESLLQIVAGKDAAGCSDGCRF